MADPQMRPENQGTVGENTPGQPAGGETGKDRDAERLDAYATQEGLWNPEHGALEQPEGWEFLPSGDPFITRRVKAAGTYWLLWRPRGRGRAHRRLLGLLAPAQAISAARADAAETAATRSARQAQGALYRDRKEDAYRQELAEAIVAFLAFSAEHADLAKSIAAEASKRAAEVGSRRVGRTRMLTVEDRAALAARALIRHRFTDYEDRLITEVWDDDYLYREVKVDAHTAVDEFLRRHRAP